MENLKGRQKLGCAGLMLGLPLWKIPVTFGLVIIESHQRCHEESRILLYRSFRRNKISLYTFQQSPATSKAQISIPNTLADSLEISLLASHPKNGKISLENKQRVPESSIPSTEFLGSSPVEPPRDLGFEQGMP